MSPCAFKQKAAERKAAKRNSIISPNAIILLGSGIRMMMTINHDL